MFMRGYLKVSTSALNTCLTKLSFSYFTDRSSLIFYKIEQKEVIKTTDGTDGRLRWSDVQKMKYTWRVAQELMRVTPPVFGNFKKTTKDTSFGGFDIPKGWQV